MLGAGPGLGASVARRFLEEGYAATLVSRRGFTVEGAVARKADLTDPAQIRDVIDDVDVLYFGPAVMTPIVPLPSAGPDDVRRSLEVLLLPAVTAVQAALDRNVRAILLPGGLSGLHPMPMLGSLAPASAALRMYALTLHDALEERGVYVGVLTIGGLIARGDIHAMVTAQHEGEPLETLDPDAIADAAWQMVAARTPAEHISSTLQPNGADRMADESLSG
ncbi:short-chain dehydrogenase [Actinoplanes sp. NBRC 103695]|nr:short-chain dehydrogenase [Actinoplanes sp. NBRC 103695]